MKISILGSAVTQFGELWDQSLVELMNQAMTDSLEDAATNSSITVSQIEAVFVANKAAGSFENQHHLNALASQFFDHLPPAMRVEAACASGGLALLAAEHALLAGQYKTVMVVGVEKMTDVSGSETTRILSGAADATQEYGSTFPALYGLLTQLHSQKFGTTRQQLSQVAVKNHLHALSNPHAQFHKGLTVEQVSKSTLVAEPIRLLDCSPISDGAAAVILTTQEFAGKDLTQITGFGHGQDHMELAHRKDLTTFAATQKAAQQAFTAANLKPSDISAAEVHDCFTIGEILAIEDLGFFAKGEGGKATEVGLTTADTSAQKTANKSTNLPVNLRPKNGLIINPSGGLKGCGHPVGATGVKQLAYLHKYLQQNNFRYGLTHNVGGAGATAVVHILENQKGAK